MYYLFKLQILHIYLHRCQKYVCLLLCYYNINPFNLSGYETHITPSINDQTIQVNKEK